MSDRAPRSRRTIAFVTCAAVAFLALAGASSTAAPPAPDPRIVAVGDIACQSFSQSDGEGACRSDEVAAAHHRPRPRSLPGAGRPPVQQRHARGVPARVGRAVRPPVADHEARPGQPRVRHRRARRGTSTTSGAIAHGPQGYYSFDLGAWHVVSLNSDVCGDDPGCGPGSPQYEWLADDLAANDDARARSPSSTTRTFDWRQWQHFVDPDSETRTAVRRSRTSSTCGR